MNHLLLRKLADLLDTVPEDQFDYGSWIGGQCETVGQCGTTACALGWATTMPETGLAFYCGRIVHLSGGPSQKECGVLAAARVAFDLAPREADALFLSDVPYRRLGEDSPSMDATAKQVAAWIRRVVDEDERSTIYFETIEAAQKEAERRGGIGLGKGRSEGAGEWFIADQGKNVWPRFAVLLTPMWGNPVSKTINGDYYPDGHILSVSPSLGRIETTTGSVYFRKGKSGVFACKGWRMVRGHRNERNPHF